MKSYNPEIYISYAWGDDTSESGKLRSAFNEKIIELLQEKQFNLIIDRNELSYKDSIRSFMERIGEGHFIIVILSDKYLTSKYCLYELLMILKNQNLKERIFPVVLSDARIDDPVEKLKYYQYWEDQIQKLNNSLKQIKDFAYIGPVQKELREFAEYKRMIMEFTSLTADMITIRVDSNNIFNPDNLIQSLEKSVVKYSLEKYGEEVIGITTKYNKRLQTLSDSKKLREQETFTRGHLKIMKLPLDTLKQMLHLLGYLKIFNKDNKFSIQVADAIERFQSAEGLQPVDGIYGPDAHRALTMAVRKSGLI